MGFLPECRVAVRIDGCPNRLDPRKADTPTRMRKGFDTDSFRLRNKQPEKMDRASPAMPRQSRWPRPSIAIGRAPTKSVAAQLINPLFSLLERLPSAFSAIGEKQIPSIHTRQIAGAGLCLGRYTFSDDPADSDCIGRDEPIIHHFAQQHSSQCSSRCSG